MSRAVRSFISLAMVLVMLLGVMPTAAYAANTEYTTNLNATFAKGAEIKAEASSNSKTVDTLEEQKTINVTKFYKNAQNEYWYYVETGGEGIHILRPACL